MEAAQHLPPPCVPPPDLLCGGVDSCKGDLATGEAQHTFFCGYVWLELAPNRFLVSYGEAVVAATSNAERDRPRIVRHDTAHNQSTSIRSARGIVRLRFLTLGTSHSSPHGVATLLGKGFCESSACVDRVQSKASGTLGRNSYYISTTGYCSQSGHQMSPQAHCT